MWIGTTWTSDLCPVLAILKYAHPDPAVGSILPGYVVCQTQREPFARLTTHVPGREAIETEVPEVVELDLSILVRHTHRSLDVPHMAMEGCQVGPSRMVDSIGPAVPALDLESNDD